MTATTMFAKSGTTFYRVQRVAFDTEGAAFPVLPVILPSIRDSIRVASQLEQQRRAWPLERWITRGGFAFAIGQSKN